MRPYTSSAGTRKERSTPLLVGTQSPPQVRHNSEGEEGGRKVSGAILRHCQINLTIADNHNHNFHTLLVLHSELDNAAIRML